VAVAAAPRSRKRALAWLVGGGVVIVAAVSLVAVTQRDAEPVPHLPIAPVVARPAPAPPVAPEIELEPTPIDRTPIVEVRSKPGGAQVIVDGTLRGVTPLTLAVALPEVVVIQRAGYRSVKQRVEHAGVVDVTLRPLRRPTPAPRPSREPLD
jgi:hypothetical protein